VALAMHSILGLDGSSEADGSIRIDLVLQSSINLTLVVDLHFASVGAGIVKLMSNPELSLHFLIWPVEREL